MQKKKKDDSKTEKIDQMRKDLGMGVRERDHEDPEHDETDILNTEKDQERENFYKSLENVGNYFSKNQMMDAHHTFVTELDTGLEFKLTVHCQTAIPKDATPDLMQKIQQKLKALEDEEEN